MTADLAALLDALEARLAQEAGMSSCFSLTPAQAAALVKVAKAADQVSAGPEGFASYSAALREALAALREQLEQEER